MPPLLGISLNKCGAWNINSADGLPSVLEFFLEVEGGGRLECFGVFLGTQECFGVFLGTQECFGVFLGTQDSFGLTRVF